MKKLIITLGLPGSGKDFWCENFMKNNPGKYKRINKDKLREMFDFNQWTKDNEKFILQIRNNLIEISLNEGFSVISTDTNLHPKHLNKFKELAERNNAELIIQDFTNITVEECIKRDQKRNNYVGEKVIRDMYNQFLKPKIEPLIQDILLPHAIICDLDGTLAIHQNRGPYEYDKCDTDLINIVIQKILKTRNFDTHIIFVSGREDSCEFKTKLWLELNGFPCTDYKLFMRKTGDHRKDVIIKKEIFDAEIRDKYYIEFVLDDRLQVCRMWYELGLTLLKVGNPDADF